jgi:hypothetical protein
LENPDSLAQYPCIKVLDLDMVNEIAEHTDDLGMIDPIIKEKISNFLDYKYFIIPIMKLPENTCMIVVLENHLDPFKNNILVRLFDRDRSDGQSEEESSRQSEETSNIVHAVIQLALGVNTVTSYQDEIEGETEIIDVEDEQSMILAILQIAEAIVVHRNRFPNETLENYKHKI